MFDVLDRRISLHISSYIPSHSPKPRLSEEIMDKRAQNQAKNAPQSSKLLSTKSKSLGQQMLDRLVSVVIGDGLTDQRS